MIYLINPALVCFKGDSHSSGIPYMPHGLAYLSAALQKKNISHKVIDAFAEAPKESYSAGDHLMLGLSPKKVVERISVADCEAIVLYANSVFNSQSLFDLANALNEFEVPIIAIENTQAVTGFSLLKVFKEVEKTPIDFVVLGESEAVLPEIMSELLKGSIPDRYSRHVWKKGEPIQGKENAFVADLDSLPFPNWSAFPLKNYWDLGYAHGPVSGKYLALLTSRGCPYPCGFCSVPVMNQNQWRMRSAKNVVEEIKHFYVTLGIKEFHWEDLNPTIRETRILEICELIKEQGLPIQWKIVSGTKLDNLKLETLRKMAGAGLNYVSFSPESGSKEVLKKIKKPFQHEHALDQVKLLRSLHVETQACFVLGYPGETESDRILTETYSQKLLLAGLGEVAYFIVSPMPGTAIEGKLEGNYRLTDLNFSSAWRNDYELLIDWRNRLYRKFFLYRIFKTPFFFLQNLLRAFTGVHRLKMEMFPRRKVRTFLSQRRASPLMVPITHAQSELAISAD